MIYNIFTTESEAQTSCDADWVKYQADMPTSKTTKDENDNDVIAAIDNTKYLSVTTCWDCPKQRLDGKWVYAKYSQSSQNLTEETYSSDWFNSEE